MQVKLKYGRYPVGASPYLDYYCASITLPNSRLEPLRTETEGKIASLL